MMLSHKSTLTDFQQIVCTGSSDWASAVEQAARFLTYKISCGEDPAAGGVFKVRLRGHPKEFENHAF